MSNNTLSKNASLQAKGILALLVFAHHIYQATGVFSGTYVGYLLQACGYWAVAVFFFLSGYGLTVSYLNKGNEYTKSLLIKKVAPFITVYVILTGIYALVSLSKSDFSLTAGTVLQSFMLGKTIVGNGWYLQVQILLYIFFWLAFFGKSTKKSLALLVLFCCAYMVFAKVSQLSVTYYISIPSFLLGTAMAFPKFKSFFCMKNRAKVLLCATFAVASPAFYLAWKYLGGHWVANILLGFSTVCFSLFFILFSMLIYNERFNICLFGKISFEFYVCQGLAMTFFRSDIIYISNNYLYILICFAATLVVSILFHYVVNGVFSLWGKVGSNKKTHKAA